MDREIHFSSPRAGRKCGRKRDNEPIPRSSCDLTRSRVLSFHYAETVTHESSVSAPNAPYRAAIRLTPKREGGSFSGSWCGEM